MCSRIFAMNIGEHRGDAAEELALLKALTISDQLANVEQTCCDSEHVFNVVTVQWTLDTHPWLMGKQPPHYPWHLLYFRPEPQGQGSLRPTLRCPQASPSQATEQSIWALRNNRLDRWGLECHQTLQVCTSANKIKCTSALTVAALPSLGWHKFFAGMR